MMEKRVKLARIAGKQRLIEPGSDEQENVRAHLGHLNDRPAPAAVLVPVTMDPSAPLWRPVS
jgi:hypothetical protein